MTYDHSDAATTNYFLICSRSSNLILFSGIFLNRKKPTKQYV